MLLEFAVFARPVNFPAFEDPELRQEVGSSISQAIEDRVVVGKLEAV